MTPFQTPDTPDMAGVINAVSQVYNIIKFQSISCNSISRICYCNSWHTYCKRSNKLFYVKGEIIMEPTAPTGVVYPITAEMLEPITSYLTQAVSRCRSNRYCYICCYAWRKICTENY